MSNKKLRIVLTSFIFAIASVALFYTLIRGENIFNVFREDALRGKDDTFSFLALGRVGVGQGGQWHFAPDLTDTIMLIHFRPETDTVNLISLPRDLYGTFGDSDIRINRVVSDNKIEGLMEVMTDIVGIEVDKYVVIDLGIMEEVVNQLGGIRVNLSSPVYDPVGSFSLDAGWNDLDGEDAVWLVRNRYAPEGDFFREKNQHLVMEAIFSKFNELNSFRKTSFIFGILPEISKSTSNFSLGQAVSDFRSTSKVSFNSIVLDFNTGLWQSTTITTYTGEDAYIILPREGMNKYEAIRTYVQENLK